RMARAMPSSRGVCSSSAASKSSVRRPVVSRRRAPIISPRPEAPGPAVVDVAPPVECGPHDRPDAPRLCRGRATYDRGAESGVGGGRRMGGGGLGTGWVILQRDLTGTITVPDSDRRVVAT